MAGGVGSRFWPASREHLPKQFLDITGTGKSLIRLTFERSLNLVPAENILIATNEKYKELTQEHLPEIPEKNILLEPSRNNTAPCIAYACLKIKSINPDAVFAVLPSDHMILKEVSFVEKINQAFDFAVKNEALVTLGLTPTRPDTGYGYIETAEKSGDILKVTEFKEKPDRETAEKYLESGNYLWNAGIFIWSVKTLLNTFKKNAPQIIEVLSKDESVFNTQKEQAYINEQYPKTESISVDYAILERSDNVYTIPADIGWSDLGTWNSLHDYLEKDAEGNVIQAENALVNNTKNTFVKTLVGKQVVIKGLENFIVVDEEDVLLIYPKEDEQEIKSVRQSITNEKYL